MFAAPNRVSSLSVTVLLCACVPIGSEKSVYGRYELTSPDATIYLDVRPEHAYFETIRYATGTEQTTSGAWRWTEEKDRWDPRVCFEGLFSRSN